MRDIVYNILAKYYGPLYGLGLCENMADQICERIIEGKFTSRADIQMYVWMNTSGGGVAESVGWEMHELLPHLISDSKYETRDY